MQVFFLFTELFLLYFLSRWLTQAVYDFSILLFRARSVAVTIVTLLNFPGTVIHELAHLFTAEILGVHTGKLTLVPEGIQGTDIRAGSVMIAETDPFRRYAIGLAPIVVGMIAVTALSYFLPQIQNIYLLIGDAYLIFAVSNSMFSSPEDLKGFIPFIITLAILVGAGYIAGLRIGLTGVLLEVAIRVLDALVKSLGLVLLFNVVGLLLFKLLIGITGKITHRRIIR